MNVRVCTTGCVRRLLLGTLEIVSCARITVSGNSNVEKMREFSFLFAARRGESIKFELET